MDQLDDTSVGPSTDAPEWSGVVLIAATFLAGVALWSAPASAQSTEGSPTVERAISVPGHSNSWTVRLASSDETEGSSQLLSIRSPEDDIPVAEIALPGWAGPPKYGLEVQTGRLSDDHMAVLATVSPSSKAPDAGTAVTIQAAWVAHRTSPGDDWRWDLVRRVQFSALDGGKRLELRTAGGEGELVQIPNDGATTFCGSNETGVVERLFDVDSSQFVRNVDLEENLKGAKEIEAALPTKPFSGPFTRGLYQWYWASSSTQTSSEASGTVRPLELGDRRGGSAWTIDARKGVRGEYATANVETTLPIDSFQIVPGLAAGRDAYREYGRPKRLLLSLSDGSRYVVALPDVPYRDLARRRGLIVTLPSPVETSCVSVVVLEAYDAPAPPEDGSRPVALAEVAPLTVVDRSSAAETAEAIVARIAEEPDLRKRRRIAHAAIRLQDELTTAVESALAKTDGEERRRIIPLLQNLPPDRAVPLLMDFLEELHPDDVEFRAVKRSLAVHSEQAGEPLSKMVAETDVDHDKYIDLVRLLGRVGKPRHLSRLTADFGEGSDFLRNERIRAVAAGGEPVLSKLFSVVAVEGSSPKGRDALKAIYLVGKRNHRDELGAREGTDALDKIFRHADDRRTLLLAFRAARYYRVEGFVQRVERSFLEHSDPLVREGALRAASRYPTPRARKLLLEALDDPNPDVRIAAIDGIEAREDRRRAVGRILEYVRRESWGEGRQRALNVLAAIETPRTDAYFRELLAKRRHEKPKLAARAATTLSRANRRIDAELAREIALDADANRRLRTEMIDLLGLDESQAGETFLLTLINPAEAAGTIDDEDLRREFERRALMSLGRRRSERARSRMFKMAKTGSDFRLRRHALRALAFYRSEELVKKLEAWKPEAPTRLRGVIDQTIGIIENRGAIESVQDQIGRTLKDESSSKPSKSR